MADDFLIVANAANIDKDLEWLDYLRRSWPGDGGPPVNPDDVVIGTCPMRPLSSLCRGPSHSTYWPG